MPFDTPENCMLPMFDDELEPMKRVKPVDGYKLKTLKTCPFCNSLDVEVRFDPNEKRLAKQGYKGEYKMYCKKCGAYGPGMPQYYYAVRLWDDRLRDEKLNERITEFNVKISEWLSNIPSTNIISRG